MKSVLFVIDDDKQPREYVKAIIKQHPNIIPEDKVLDAKDKTIRLLNELIADEMIRKTGNGRGTKYLIKC
ncbi:hypothetical protein [Moryella indoligenes]|uniref:hypothetical protein n=1 Tax=Moryella indoligenes TaxID=371674 RepID=UPI0027D84116|nr:hypothetical protein [Moryella indoligenes]